MEKITANLDEFINNIKSYIDKSSNNIILIADGDSTIRVLVDISEYNRLYALDTRAAFFAEELTAEELEDMGKNHGPRNEHLDHLMDERLDALAARKAFFAEELPKEVLEHMRTNHGPGNEDLDHLDE